MLACCFIPFVMQGVMHVQVVAMVTKPEQVRSDDTNTFHLIFNTKLDVAGVLPASSRGCCLGQGKKQ